MSIFDETYSSPNFGYPRGSAGRRGHKIIAIGVHIGGGLFQSNYNHIMNPNAQASYNAYVKLDGKVVQFVAEENAAWSHGKIVSPSWPLLKSGVNPNIYTLSISREGSNQNTWTPEQMESTIRVIKYWGEKYDIPLKRPYIFGHFEIDSVGRWYCPGKPFFDALIVELAKEPEEIPEAVIEAPDVDREWIDNHPKEFDGKDPYQDRLTFGDLPPDRAIRERRRPK